MKAENSIVGSKSYDFALRIMKLRDHLYEKKEFDVGKQIFRSGTSICANIEEGLGGQSRKDFLAKISISYKEARETRFWLRLLRDSEKLEVNLATSFLEDCEELMRIIGSIIKTVKATPNS
jgi:four helix bundle protein